MAKNMNVAASLAPISIPQTPNEGITEFGGETSPQWLEFFDAAGNMIRQASQVFKNGEVHITRIGSVAFVTGMIDGELQLPLKPVCSFASGGVAVDDEGILQSDGKPFSTSFITR